MPTGLVVKAGASVEIRPAGQVKLLLKMAELRLVQLGDACGELGALRQQMDLDAAAILTSRAPLHQTQLRTAVHQGHRAVVLGLQSLGQLPHRGPLTSLEPLEMQQQLILERSHALLSADIVALAQEAAQLVAEVRQPLEVLLGQSNTLRHGAPIPV